jgi:hypothetical protein
MKRIALVLIVLFTVLAPAFAQTAPTYFVRPKAFKGSILHLDLICDGDRLGVLKNGGFVVAEMTAGKHTCQIGDSNLVAIVVDPGGSTFHVTTGMTQKSMILGLRTLGPSFTITKQ